MKRALLWLCLALTLTVPGLANPAKHTPNDLLTRLLSIADADQVQAYQSLDLSPDQQRQLRLAALEFLPRVEQAQNTPGGHFLLLPEALRRVDGILTPAQRPMARKLIPRAHQWPKLKSLYQDYRSSGS